MYAQDHVVVVVLVLKMRPCRAGEVRPCWTEPLWERVSLYWEVLKVDFALEMLDKKLLYVRWWNGEVGDMISDRGWWNVETSISGLSGCLNLTGSFVVVLWNQVVYRVSTVGGGALVEIGTCVHSGKESKISCKELQAWEEEGFASMHFNVLLKEVLKKERNLSFIFYF